MSGDGPSQQPSPSLNVRVASCALQIATRWQAVTFKPLHAPTELSQALPQATLRSDLAERRYGDNQYRFMLMCLAALEAPLNLPLQARSCPRSRAHPVLHCAMHQSKPCLIRGS